MAELITAWFAVTLPDGADNVEEIHSTTADIPHVWRYLGPNDLFWTVSTHAGAGAGVVFGGVLSRYRSQPAFVLLWEADEMVPTGRKLSTSVSFRDFQLAPVRVDAVAVDLCPERVLMVQLAIPGREPPDVDLMTTTIETLRIF